MQAIWKIIKNTWCQKKTSEEDLCSGISHSDYVEDVKNDLSRSKELVLIDDDPLIIRTWSYGAKREGYKISCFGTIDEFISEIFLYRRSILIFVDSLLGDGLLGEKESERIFKMGYKNIHITSGRPIEEIRMRSWIRGVVGKAFPRSDS